MCKPFSAIVTRNAVLWSRNSDKHEDTIAENHLNDKTTAPDFVRVELTPQNMDFRKPISEWLFKVDQDYLPDWWSHEWADTIIREEAARWLDMRTIKTEQTVMSGLWFVFAGSPVITQLGGNITACDQSTPVITQFNGRIVIYNQSTPMITQSNGVIVIYNQSTPMITQSNGVIEAYNHSAPVITQSGGEISTYNHSAPVITQSGGKIRIFDQSAPVIIKTKGV